MDFFNYGSHDPFQRTILNTLPVPRVRLRGELHVLAVIQGLET